MRIWDSELWNLGPNTQDPGTRDPSNREPGTWDSRPWDLEPWEKDLENWNCDIQIPSILRLAIDPHHRLYSLYCIKISIIKS